MDKTHTFVGKLPSSLDLLPLGERFGDKEMMKAKFKPNAKFNAIKARVDCGKKEFKASDFTDVNQIVTQLKGELFGRMSPDVLAKYLKECYLASDRSEGFLNQEMLRTGPFPPKLPPPESTAPKIMLLDLRPVEDYKKWRIMNAISFPSINIQRDHVFSQLNLIKNKPDKLLVVYMDDERHGTQIAQQIFEKGFDNVYLLTGGISVFGYENQNLLDGSNIPSKKELQAFHQVATTKVQKPKNMQSSKGFTKSMGTSKSDKLQQQK